jgi:AsmA protein
MVKRLKTTLKIALIVLVALPTLIVGGFSGAILWIDFNQYKPLIEEEVFAKTGRRLTIDGEISARPWPLELSLGESRLAQPSGFDSAHPFLAFEQLNLRLSLSRLIWSGELHLLGAEVLAPKLHLIEQDGRQNWQDMLADNGPRSPWQTVSQSPLADSPSWLALLRQVKLDALSIHQGEIHWQGDGQHWALTPFELIAFDVQLGQRMKWQFDGEWHSEGVQFVFQLPSHVTLAPDLSRVELHDARVNLHVRDSREPTPDYRVQLDLQHLDWQPPAQSMAISFAELSLLGSRINLELSGHYGDEFDIQGRTTLTEFNPRAWLQHWQINHPDFVKAEALTRVKGQFDWALTGQGWRVHNMLLNVDNTQISGFFAQQQQDYQFDLHVGQLNLDDYAANKQSAADDTVNASTYLPIAIPIRTLRESGLQGQLVFDQLTLWQTHYQNLQLAVNSAYGQLDLAPLDADLYQGQLRASLRVNVNQDVPQFAFKGRLIGLELQPWLADSLDYRDLSGALSAWFDMRSQGSNSEAIKSHLNGQFSAELQAGRYFGAALSPEIKMPLDFQQLSVRGEALDGVFHLQQAQLEAAQLSAQAFGQINLVQAQANMRLQMRLANAPQAAPILVQMQGSLREPTWQ